MSADVLFTGGVPAESVESVFRTLAAAVGDRALGYPDGEIGDRFGWIRGLNTSTWPHVDGVEVTKPPADSVATLAARLKPGVTEVDLRGVLPYSRDAIESYGVFSRLREEGVIPAGVRFHMAIPAAYDAVAAVFANPDDRPIVMDAWTNALQDEYARMLKVIPAEDLQIQIDWCLELMAATDSLGQLALGEPGAEVLERLSSSAYIAPHVRGLPEDVLLGFHICAGTAPKYPRASLPDMTIPVIAANAIVGNAGRRVDFLHLPVLDTSGDEYFAPLADLDAQGAKVFLGLECNDGLEAMTRRMDSANKYLEDFGVAHYCGYFWNLDNMPELLQVLNAGADHLATLR